MAIGPRLFIAVFFLLISGAPLTAQVRTAYQAPHDLPAPSVLDRPARIAIRDAPLLEALQVLSRRSGVNFAYSASLLPSEMHSVSCLCEELTVGAALDLLLTGTRLQYLEVDDQVVIFPRSRRRIENNLPWLVPRLPPSSIAVLALGREIAPLAFTVQTGTVQGRVVEDASSAPLPSAQVFVVGAGIGMLTDSAGRFQLLNVPTGEHTITATLIGYAEARQRVVVPDGGAVRIELRLNQQAVSLDEIVVTGTAQGQAMRALGNTVGTVRTAAREQIAPAQDMTRLLTGVVPGVRVMQSAGDIGAGANIRIRGASSLSLSSAPLLYVDGVRMNNNSADEGGGVGGVVFGSDPPSRINDLNPDDIERIEIIKGPAAATLYGTEASNGVINVITKRGRVGRPTFTLTLKQGGNYIPSPEDLFPSTYYRCSGVSATTNVPDEFKCQPGEITEFNVLRFNRIAHGQEPFRTGQAQSYDLGLSGGSDELRYYFSGEWAREEGPVTYNWENKLTGRANLSWTPNEKLDLQLGVGGLNSKLQSAVASQPLTTAIIWSCRAPGCEAGSGHTFAMDGPWRGYGGYLPESFEEDIEGIVELNRLTYSITARHRPFSWLSHRATAGVDFTDSWSSELYKQGGVFRRFSVEGVKHVQEQRTRFVTLDYSATGNFDPTADLNFAPSIGLQHYQKSNKWLYAIGETFPVRALETISAGASKNAQEEFTENRTLGAFVQGQFSWKNRIFLTGAVRGDDNSAFGQQFDFVTYPKVSASWVLSEEPFLSDRLTFLDALKLRAAWGQAGQQPDVFAALRTYRPRVGPGGAPIMSPENIGNPGLEPEVGEEIEAGFDVGVLGDRLGIEFTYYDKTTKSAIVRVPALPSLGFPGFQFRNIGEVSNRGLELGVRGSAYQGERVQLELGFNYSRNDNEVVDLGDEPPLILSAAFGQMHVPGFPMGALFRKRVVSADIQGSGPSARAVNVMCEGGSVITGTNFSRGGGAPVPCASAPDVYWGGPLPTWEGAANATLTLFRNLQLFGLVDYVGGHTLLSGDVGAAHIFYANSKAILERTDPILLGYEALGDAGVRQPGIFDGGFARLRTVSATYRLPTAWAERIGASRASLNLTGTNLAMIWQAQKSAFGHRQPDIEVRNNAGSATDPGGLSMYNQEGWPQLRRFLFTARVAF